MSKIDIFNTDKKYNIIYADPPWAYQQGGRGAAKNHYKTMKTEDICSMPISNICTEDAVLFLWATFPNIKEAFKVMERWGFTYKTAAFTWIKQNKKQPTLFWGGGSYTRANAEVCLIGVKKNFKASKQIKRRNVHSVVLSKVGIHSTKPAEVRTKIVELLGDIPRIELFARQHAEGWDCWGNEV